MNAAGDLVEIDHPPGHRGVAAEVPERAGIRGRGVPGGEAGSGAGLELARRLGGAGAKKTGDTRGVAGWRKRDRTNQICEYAVGTRKRAVFFDVLLAHLGSSFIFPQRGSGPNFFQFARCVAKSGPEVM